MPRDKGKDIGTRLGSMILDHFIMTFGSIVGGAILVGVLFGLAVIFVDFNDKSGSTILLFLVHWLCRFISVKTQLEEEVQPKEY